MSSRNGLSNNIKSGNSSKSYQAGQYLNFPTDKKTYENDFGHDNKLAEVHLSGKRDEKLDGAVALKPDTTTVKEDIIIDLTELEEILDEPDKKRKAQTDKACQ